MFTERQKAQSYSALLDYKITADNILILHKWAENGEAEKTEMIEKVILKYLNNCNFWDLVFNTENAKEELAFFYLNLLITIIDNDNKFFTKVNKIMKMGEENNA